MGEAGEGGAAVRVDEAATRQSVQPAVTRVRPEWLPTAIVVAVFVVVRLAATVGAPIGVTGDTPSYFDFHLWGGRRFPGMTAFYALVANDRAIVTIQAVLGAAAWAVAAVLLATLIERRGYRMAFLIVMLLLGLTTPVTGLDTALLSESTSTSLEVLLSALLIRTSARPTRVTAVCAIVVAAVWVSMRQGNAIVAFVIAAAVFAVLLRGHARRALRIAGPIAAFALVGLVLASANTTVQEDNIAQVLQRRIVGHDAHERWFVAHAMPANGQEVLSRPLPNEIFPFLALTADPGFQSWIETHGTTTYAQFLLTHPTYVLSTSVHDRTPLREFLSGVDAPENRSRAVMPARIDRVYWQRSGTDIAIALAVLCPLVAVAVFQTTRRRRLPPGATMALALLGVAVINLVVVTHLAGRDYARLLMPASVSAHVVGLWLLAAVLGMTRQH